MSRKSAISASDLVSSTPAGALVALTSEREKEIQRGERAVRQSPDFSAPWVIVERAASKMRIRALARVLDPTALLDDDAVEVRGVTMLKLLHYYYSIYDNIHHLLSLPPPLRLLMN